MSKKSLFIRFFLIVCVSVLFAGCTININVGNSSDASENGTTPDHGNDITASTSTYQSRATIYISQTVTTDSTMISSDDLTGSSSLMETYKVILKSKRIQGKIQEDYPEIEYELTLEQINETEMFAITATSERPEKLEEICNMAVSLFSEEVSNIIEGVSCKVVDHAKPAQLVEKN